VVGGIVDGGGMERDTTRRPRGTELVVLDEWTITLLTPAAMSRRRAIRLAERVAAELAATVAMLNTTLAWPPGRGLAPRVDLAPHGR
jgi:hypothetical protein